MFTLLRLSKKFSHLLVWIGGGLLVVSAFIVTLEVVLRKVFTISLGGADELSGYAFGIATTFGLAYALFQRAHIRVDALYEVFPAWLKLIADCVGIVLLAGFTGVICTTAWQLVADTITHNSHSITPLHTPLVIPQVLWLFGWLFFLFSMVLVICVVMLSIIRGDIKTARSLIGTKTINEQIEETCS